MNDEIFATVKIDDLSKRHLQYFYFDSLLHSLHFR